MIEKLLFLQHGGGNINIPGQQIPAGTSPVPAIILLAIILTIGVGLWVLFSRKKRI
jgi:hypothetical protein